MATYYWVGGTGNWSDATNHWATASNGAPNAANVPTSVDDVIFDVNSNVGTGSFSVTLTALGDCRNFTASGLDGVMTFSPGLFTMRIAGNLSIPATNFTTASIAGGFSFTGSGTSTITTNGVTINHNVQMNGTGTLQLLDPLTLASNRTFTLLLGTFQLNGFTLTTGLFNSNTGGVRTLAFGSGGQISITGQNATVLNVGTITNMTITSGAIPGTFSLTANPISGTRTVQTGLWTTVGSLFRVNVTAGSDTVQTQAAFNVDNFDLTGFTGTFTRGVSDNYYGNYTLNSSVTLTSTAAQQSTFISFSGRTNTIQTFGKTLDFPITFNGNGVTWQLQDALTQGSTRAFTFSDGTIQFKNGTTNTVGSFVTSGSTLKFLASTTAGSQATISQASGSVVVTYLSIQDSIATGGATFDATDPTNVNAGNNTGWLTTVIRTLFARATSNGNFLIPTEMEFNEVNQTNFRVSKNNLSVYANEFDEIGIGVRSQSLKFDGSTGYLSVPYSSNFEFSNKDFTIEFWIYAQVDLSGFGVMAFPHNASNFAQVLFFGSGSSLLLFSSSNGTSFDVSPGSAAMSVTLGAWNHIAVSKSGSSIRCFSNGILQDTVTFAGTFTGTYDRCWIGDTVNNSHYNGLLSNIRVVNGTALYTANFVPPVTTLSSVANTVLLLNNLAAEPFKDNGPNNLTITVNGSVTANTLTPFNAQQRITNTGNLLISGTFNELSDI